MKDTLYGKYYTKLFEAASRMNEQAKEKDLLRNHVNYGVLTTTCEILTDMGHKVDTCVYGDGDYLISAKLIIDGETKFEF